VCDPFVQGNDSEIQCFVDGLRNQGPERFMFVHLLRFMFVPNRVIFIPPLSHYLTPPQCPIDSTTGQPYTAFAPLLDSWQCSSSSLSSQYLPADLSFPCNLLPLCHVTCTGPDPTVLTAVGELCSCSAQWSIHSTIIQILVTVVLFVTINFARYAPVTLTHVR